GMTHADRLQIATPPFHILGLLNLSAVVAAGASARLHRRFDLDTVLHAIETDGITIEMAVAPIALAIASHPDLERFDLSTLRYIMWGATPVTASVAETITRRTGVPVMAAYGASELPFIAANPVDRPDEWRLDSVGPPPADVAVRVVDLDTGDVLGPGLPGELQLRSPSLMVGYLTSEGDGPSDPSIVDGWYATGDVGTVDANGWITITDRVKEMIKVNGFQVAPAEVEGVLLGHDAVADCAVFGVPDERTGERVVAAVVLRDGAVTDFATTTTTTTEELQRLVAASLASYKRLAEVVFVDEIPRLPSGKVLRRELRAGHTA
ncbi:MAG: AMP-binding protein, partial [Ilumatobacteraceae bacterium]